MSNVFKRPMFRRGGLTTRVGYAGLGSVDSEQIPDRNPFLPFEQPQQLPSNQGKGITSVEPQNKGVTDINFEEMIREKMGKPKDNRLYNFLARFGPALANQTGGSLLQNIARASADPTEALLSETAAMDNRNEKIKGMALELEMQDKQRRQAITDKKDLMLFEDKYITKQTKPNETALTTNYGFAQDLVGLGDIAVGDLTDEQKELIYDEFHRLQLDDGDTNYGFLDDYYPLEDINRNVPDRNPEESIAAKEARNSIKKMKKEIHKYILENNLTLPDGKPITFGEVDFFDEEAVSETGGDIKEYVFYKIQNKLEGNPTRPPNASYMYKKGGNTFFFDEDFQFIESVGS
tara:strand:+ start:15783 stop:16826 length:1044 start_codon:yes stop_codon:yes gene_type:complete